MNEDNTKQRAKRQKYSAQFKDQVLERAEKVVLVLSQKTIGT